MVVKRILNYKAYNAFHPVRKFSHDVIRWGGSVTGHKMFSGAPGGYERDGFYQVHTAMLKGDTPWWRPLNQSERAKLRVLYPSEVLVF